MPSACRLKISAADLSASFRSVILCPPGLRTGSTGSMAVWWKLLLPLVSTTMAGGLALTVYAFVRLGLLQGLSDVWSTAEKGHTARPTLPSHVQFGSKAASADRGQLAPNLGNILKPAEHPRSLQWNRITCTVFTKNCRQIILAGAHCNAKAREVVALLGESSCHNLLGLTIFGFLPLRPASATTPMPGLAVELATSFQFFQS